MLEQKTAIHLSADEVHLVREWFDSVQDLSPDYLEPRDYTLAQRVYEAVGMRVPNDVSEKASDTQSGTEGLVELSNGIRLTPRAMKRISRGRSWRRVAEDLGISYLEWNEAWAVAFKDYNEEDMDELGDFIDADTEHLI